jgi:ribosomal protein L11 methyltransferase
MPYRIDVCRPAPEAFDLLIELGALDIEPTNDGLAAIIPDQVTQDRVRDVLGVARITVSAAAPRDNGSVWLLRPRPVRIGSVQVASPEAASSTGALKLIDSLAFGTGHHPTTALCIEALEEILSVEPLDRVLDVGTGSGILALAALKMGVAQAVGVDIDPDALKVAAENARLNTLADRLQLVLGFPNAVNGKWPLVLANVLPAPLIEMAPVLVQRVGKRGRLVLSGIPSSLEREVRQAYQHHGMHYVGSKARAGWTVVMAQAAW